MMTRHRRGAARRGGLGARAAAAAALTVALAASPAAAGICGLQVFGSDFGVQRAAPKDDIFKKGAQFQICFKVVKDGYVTLWDRIPFEGETIGKVERLVPGAFFEGEGTAAAKVKAGETRCFGDGKNGYYLVMDPQDGVGLGLMWLVYTPTEDDHPTIASFSSPKEFESAWVERYGAGTVRAKRPADKAPSVSCDDPQLSLTYAYRVVK